MNIIPKLSEYSRILFCHIKIIKSRYKKNCDTWSTAVSISFRF